MLSHVFVGVVDFESAFAFYMGIMGDLGYPLRFCELDGYGPAGCPPTRTGSARVDALIAFPLPDLPPIPEHNSDYWHDLSERRFKAISSGCGRSP
jgi:hypothetical protein